MSTEKRQVPKFWGDCVEPSDDEDEFGYWGERVPVSPSLHDAYEKHLGSSKFVRHNDLEGHRRSIPHWGFRTGKTALRSPHSALQPPYRQ
ncbi:hypothetical protein F444_20429 [Phytophthora nicotianae P1976]|uniref:Uncharacterized protein n=1 Tax=Phytophthora nicotianae P1976 TaxID=1317066 RepID=A0A080Z4M1_PHYNI|nr:hypothetical protein F444_20429 [Phytophthora nicotianae P1976]